VLIFFYHIDAIQPLDYASITTWLHMFMSDMHPALSPATPSALDQMIELNHQIWSYSATPTASGVTRLEYILRGLGLRRSGDVREKLRGSYSRAMDAAGTKMVQ
jgi:hypothetical protein